ncbi:MAG TPA: carbohydrate kinase family protein [Longilinea sp.]|nr:carbohydrate kinase family protein [Longilinea sp.]
MKTSIEERSEVVVLGAAAVDIVARVTEMPRKDSIIFADSCEAFPGGAGANVASGIARLGRQVTFLGKFGSDENGKLLRDAFEKDGVDTSAIITVEGEPSARCFIPIDANGDRWIFALGGTALLESVDEVNTAKIQTARVLYVAEAFTAVAQKAFHTARQAGAVVVYCPGGVVMWADRSEMEGLMRQTDVLILSRAEATAFSGNEDIEKALSYFEKIGPRVVVITLGGEGVIACLEGVHTRIPIWQAPVVADTTGAGDAFNAGFIVGFLEGLTWEQALVQGSATAAVKLGKVGARTGLPTRSELNEFMKIMPPSGLS